MNNEDYIECGKILEELNQIAKELNVSLIDSKVISEHSKRRKKGYKEEIANLIFPIYFRTDNRIYGVLTDENGNIIAHKYSENGEYEYLEKR